MTAWIATFCPVGVETHEGQLHRVFAEVRWRDLPLTLAAVFEDQGAHYGAVPVGTIREVWIEDGLVMARGEFADGDENGERAANLVAQQTLRGVSIDGTDGEVSIEVVMVNDDGGETILDPEEGMEQLWDPEFSGFVRERWAWMEFGSATIVRLPAFEQGAIAIEGESAAEETDEPEEEAVAASAQRPYLAALLGHEVRVASANGARVQPAISWGVGPPAAAFARRSFDAPTPFTIHDDGTFSGHICVWGQCHVGYSHGAGSRCVMPSPSPSKYALLRSNKQTRCSDGSRVSVGVLTMDTTHAPTGSPGSRPGADEVRMHYEHTGTIIGTYSVYDDDHGVQVAGALVDGLPVEVARRAMASSPSGDWRNYGEGLDLVATLLVSTPGYPVWALEDGEPSALAASLSPPRAASKTEVAEAAPTFDARWPHSARRARLAAADRVMSPTTA